MKTDRMGGNGIGSDGEFGPQEREASFCCRRAELTAETKELAAQFLIANTGLEFSVTHSESTTYNFLIANGLRFDSAFSAFPQPTPIFDPASRL
ncbi:MAG: hypothetical protein ACRD59_15445 [Candidatus Acidiferrales bacterium]